MYVGDIIIFDTTEKDLKFGVELLKKHFHLKILRKTKLLGIEFEETDDKLYIYQSTSTDKVCIPN